MDQAYSTGIAATPYLLMAYCGGALLMFGYAAWLSLQRLRLRKLLVAVNAEATKR